MSGLDFDNGKHVLLFYKRHRWDYLEDTPARSVSGFYAWYQRLITCLERQGCTVYQNDYELARAHPHYPVGIVGAPVILQEWDLPNPAILGPSMYDHPMIHPDLMQDERFCYYLVTCDWMQAVFQRYYGPSCVQWYAGTDTELWPDTSSSPKDIDVLIYEKVRWNREIKRTILLDQIRSDLQQRGLRWHVLEYGNISHTAYRELLARSRSMVFLCEYETQGMAYQEAMSCNVPILAWEPGYCIDPYWEIHEGGPMPASAVPYFSERCGARFTRLTDFASAFDRFWAQLPHYQPRAYVERALSLDGSATCYLGYYEQIYRTRTMPAAGAAIHTTGQ